MSRTKTKTVGTYWSRCPSCRQERTMAVRETRLRGVRFLLDRGVQRSVVCLACAVRAGVQDGGTGSRRTVLDAPVPVAPAPLHA